ncbi:hypothetical protein N7519_006664 [Penicillium mononematosum]|uniref:uncharacterized protein n=1 Tax=Penicillium mononematosum TaxID=268346 RepID=UPI002548A9A4|nr:uncharacterized protein N7519_006664 [Penicillium mononematosum]KAJ6185363.1 hypothetical protein N7519_006664 [Penicillium mononematosum]
MKASFSSSTAPPNDRYGREVEDNPEDLFEDLAPEDEDTLQSKQRQVFDMIAKHFCPSLSTRPGPLLINIDGKAGTGKSHLIMLQY